MKAPTMTDEQARELIQAFAVEAYEQRACRASVSCVRVWRVRPDSLRGAVAVLGEPNAYLVFWNALWTRDGRRPPLETPDQLNALSVAQERSKAHPQGAPMVVAAYDVNGSRVYVVGTKVEPCSDDGALLESVVTVESNRVVTQVQVWALKLDGSEVFRGTDWDCANYIHRTHSYSLAHALEHEGYSMVKVWPQ